MLEARNLTCMRGDRRLFRAVSFTLDPGGLLHLAGSNGSGKTSLLRLLCGLMLPEEGKILWRGRDIRKQREDYHREMLYLGHAAAIKDDLTAFENLAMSCTLAGFAVTPGAALDALERLGLSEQVDLQARYLSQGQRRRVALARLLLSPTTPLWLLDEPYTALDRSAVDHLRSTIESHLERGGAVVLTTHQDVPIRAANSRRLDLGGATPC